MAVIYGHVMSHDPSAALAPVLGALLPLPLPLPKSLATQTPLPVLWAQFLVLGSRIDCLLRLGIEK